MKTFLTVLCIVLIVVAVVLAVIYFLGRKLSSRQVEQQALMDAAKMTVSMLIIDKKKMRFKDAGLPKIVYEQAPKYSNLLKVPVVKAKVGPKVMTLLADPQVFEQLPVKSECKVVISGIYITNLLSVRGGSVPQPKKKGLLAKLGKKDK